MQAPVRDCACHCSLAAPRTVRRTARSVRVLKKFCARSERITQNISDISRDYRG